MSFDLDILRCPACRSGQLVLQAQSLTCTCCDRRYAIVDGIPLLLQDVAVTTRLAHDDYDEHHEITDDNRAVIHNMWQTVFSEYGVTGGDVLEIGCGSGQLTRALVGMPALRRIHATDISRDFLALTQAHLQPYTDKIAYYACDANHLPFQPGVFDVVVGHSVLHHLLDYPLVLQQAAALLRPGGCAVFFEPVLQGKVMVAFLADLMLRIHAKTGYGNLDAQDCEKIRVMLRHITKHKDVGDDRAKLAAMEDKYIFDIHAFKALALEQGFVSAAYRNNPTQDGMFRYNLSQHLRMAGIDEEKISDFRFLLNAVKEMIIDMTPSDLITPMGFFVLQR